MSIFLQLALVLVAAHLAGALAERIGQSRVTGELIIGAALAFGMTHWHGGAIAGVFTQSEALGHIGEIGLALLMFRVGLDAGAGTHSSSMKWRAAAIAVAGFVPAFVAGAGLGYFSLAALSESAQPWRYVLFCGLALSVTALPVMSHIIWSLGIGHLLPSRLAIAAAGITDVACWIVVLCLIVPATGADQVPMTGLLSMAAICLVSWTLVRPALRYLVQLQGNAAGQANTTIQGLVLAFIAFSSWITAQAGVHVAIGAMLPGLLLGSEKAFAQRWQESTDGLLRLLLVPVFFVYAGMSIDLSQVGSPGFVTWTAAFITAAVATKFIGTYLAARMCGLPRSDARIVGALMNTRGMMELVVIKIGLDQGILTKDAYSILFLVAVVTTAMAAPLIRRWSDTADQAGSSASLAGGTRG